MRVSRYRQPRQPAWIEWARLGMRAVLLATTWHAWVSQASANPSPVDEARWQDQCQQMVDREVAGAGVRDERVIRAMLQTPRHEFVLPAHRAYAYFDMALPIGKQQTISSPFIVAYMTEAVSPQPSDRVLEIGTGSGYQAAILSPLVQEVYSIEIIQALADRAKQTLARLRYQNEIGRAHV